MFRNVAILTISLSIMVVLAGCVSSLKLLSEEELERALRKCEFTLKSVEPRIEVTEPKITLRGITKPEIHIFFDLEVNVTNNSTVPLATTRLDLNLFADATPIPDDVDDPTATLSVTEKKWFPVGRTVTLPMSIEVPTVKATEDFVRVLNERIVYYRVDGTFYFPCIAFEIPVTFNLTEEKRNIR